MKLKNLLSENMLRFGTKNLNEWQQRDLVVKAIMETIDQNGLHGEIRNRLMEQSPKKGATVEVDTGAGDKIVPVPTDSAHTGKAMKIIGELITAMYGPGTDNQAVQRAIYSIKTHDLYRAVLWRVQNSTMIKEKYGKNYDLIGYFLSEDWTLAGGKEGDKAVASPTIDISSPQAGIQKAMGYTKMYKDVERHLRQFNKNEFIKTWRPS